MEDKELAETATFGLVGGHSFFTIMAHTITYSRREII